MRLRYLHLKNYPPINDIKVCFASGSPLARECAIRFVVGVNGSGKSNLLRAVAEVFLALSDLRVSAFPVNLVYELGIRGKTNHRTLLLHCPGGRKKASLWIRERFFFEDHTKQDIFDVFFEQLSKAGKPNDSAFIPLIEPGNWPLRDSTPPQIALPTAVLAYTTGDLRPWRSVWNRNQDSEDFLENSEDVLNDERPAGWTIEQEKSFQLSQQASEDSARDQFGSIRADTVQFRRPILLDTTLLKCALLAVSLSQSFKVQSDVKNSLDTLLTSGGWHKLISVAFRSHLQTDNWSESLCETAHDWWLCASDVVSEPHPFEQRRTLYFDINNSFNNQGVSFVSASQRELKNSDSHGEALLSLLGGSAGENTKPFDVFTHLLELKRAGLFEDVLLRIRRNTAPEPNDEDINDDIGILRYEELSDGEQMVLGRMALFHLFHGQQDTLLLLDEPETHFNDRWKREIVDIIDDAIGRTSNDVLISTHSAIVLSDVFNNEIVMVQKTDKGSHVIPVNEPTFATDPSALMMTVFEAEDSIGKRAQEYIEEKLKQVKGTPEEISDLEQLISRMGSGFYRSELRTLLNSWRGENA
ncbi:AAA family ATPase [Shewanella sp. 4t3-1-2LB]|uniref:AAA family ATPase n=1 Tax=Shewanella sp. 4t3-1-2LB TaxID=2817682 RepID=UPI001A987BDA|nr:AAA family ATPase [Shewanella sp. 4t3-1-2LB]MBO1271129.1 AAA family ATPase [Shewanella sp. 4t3-1-2LB]